MFSHPYISFIHLLCNWLFVTSFRTFFEFPYLLLIDGRYHWALKWCQLAHHQLISQQKSHFSPPSKAKANYKAHISEKLVTSGISDVAIVSVHSEKTRLKKMIIYYYYYSGTSLIRTSLNRNLANPNGKVLVIFFFVVVVVAILTYFFLYSDGACPSSTPSLAADSTFLTCMNKDVSIHAKLLTSFTHHLASNPWPNLKFGSGTMKCNCR